MPSWLELVEKLTPNHTGQNKPSFQKKLLYLFFPRFNVTSFTFWFGLTWGILNIIVIALAKTYKDPNGNLLPECVYIRFGASITPYIRFYYHYHRILLGPFIVDNAGQVIIGWYIIWSYGFLYQHYLTKSKILWTVGFATILGNLIGSFIEFQDVRCGGTIVVACWASIYIFLLWDTLDYNIVLRLFKMVTYLVKMMALLVASLTKYSDPIGTISGFCLGFLLAMSIIKKIGDRVDEEKRFILLRLKIFIIILTLMLFIFSLSYVLVMYDRKKHSIHLKNGYDKACAGADGKRILLGW